MALESEENGWQSFVRRLARGLMEAAAVLAAAITAGLGVLYLLKQQNLDLARAAPWFAAIVSSFSLAVLYLASKRPDASTGKRITRRLDGGFRKDIVKLQVNLDIDAKAFARMCDGYSDNSDSFLLVCRQIKGDKKYSTDAIRDQIVFLKDHPHPAVRWVVFTTKANEFIAVQDFETFLATVLNEQAGRYRDGLNESEPDKAKATFFDIAEKQAFRTYEPGAPEDAVTVIQPTANCIQEGGTVRQAIRYMESKHTDWVMVVSKNCKPIGVLRLADLVSKTLDDVL